MKVAIAAFLVTWWVSFALAQDHCGEAASKNWQTHLKLKAGSVTLQWTHVYEGLDTVCGITYSSPTQQPRLFKVWGQPFVNDEFSLIAFPYCADDGCSKEIAVVDFGRGKVLQAELPLSDSQFYLEARWQVGRKELLIEVDDSPGGKPRITHFLCSVGTTLACHKE
ncbi:MAG: hypothetical protein ACREIS_15210 [Nitrospiraceae bacterium]